MSLRPLVRTTRPRSAALKWLPEGMHDGFSRFFAVFQATIIFLVAVMLAVSLLSYDSHDPSWNVSTADGVVVHNWMGRLGSTIADILWQCLGAAGALTVVMIVSWGWRIAQRRPFTFTFWRLIAGSVSLVSFATCLAALHGVMQFNGDGVSWGGAFGGLLDQAVLKLVSGTIGHSILATFTLILSAASLYMVCALTLDEWRQVFQVLHQFFSWVAQRAVSWLLRVWRFVRSEHSMIEDDLEEDTDKDIEEDEDEEDIEQKLPAPKKAKIARVKAPVRIAKQTSMALHGDGRYQLPPLELLQWPDKSRQTQIDISEEALEKNAKLLESVLSDFGVRGQITKVSPGPVVTLYELEPSPGTRASRVISLADDIARNMSAVSVRVAVVPGRNVIGIELPNAKRETVYMREMLSVDAYATHGGSLPLVLGKDISGAPVIADLTRMPHLLIAGTTGSGKSVAINTMILSLLYRLPPQKCRFIMIDPKMLELSVYEGIPHLLAPVVTEPKKAIMALKWTVREMEERYRAMSKHGVRNIDGYNMRLREAAKNGESLTRTVQTGFDRETGKPIYEEQPLDLTELPFIVVIVDEMADLMLVAGKDIEGAVQRLAQMARAAGIHIMMATQRPSVDVITGTIKANFPTRISFQLTSKIDSRTILGEQGAEQLLGQGDMLYMAGGGRITRVHGPFVRDDEVEAIVKFLKSQGQPEYLDEVTADSGDTSLGEDGGGDFGGGGGGGSGNDLYDKAVDVVLRERKASISFVQRQLQIGYNRAATLIERMEREGVISTANHVGKREILGRSPNE